jgi:uncharacterized protein (TIGR02996 family)
MPAPAHEPFLRAICDAPDDDAPRLIYADWLDENGDSERAEFIRLQVRIADSDVVNVLKARLRAEELFRKNCQQWISLLPGNISLWSESSTGLTGNVFDSIEVGGPEITSIEGQTSVDDWERGFPAAVYVREDARLFFRMKWLQEIEEFVPIHRLRLVRLNQADGFLTTLVKAPLLQKIRELIVPPDVILTNSTVAALANSPFAKQLRQLSLVAERLSDSTAMALVNSPYLRQIEMLQLLRNHFSEPVRAALRARFGFSVHC